MKMSLKQRKINFTPRIKLDYNIYTSRNYLCNKTMKFSYFFFFGGGGGDFFLFFFLASFFFFFLWGGGGEYFLLFVFVASSVVSFSSSVQLTKVTR